MLIFLILFTALAFGQNKTLDSLRNVVSDLENSAGKLPIKVSWEWMPVDSASYYVVYYCSADDINKIPIKDGVNPDDIWDWKVGSTIYNYCWVKRPLKKYLVIGLIGVNQAGKKTRLRVINVSF